MCCLRVLPEAVQVATDVAVSAHQSGAEKGLVTVPLSSSAFSQTALAGKTAIVTGGSRGIGAAIARAYAHAGATVIVAARRQATVDVVAQEINDAGGRAYGIACNVGGENDITHLVDETVAKTGRIDIVVHNAAVNPTFGPIADASENVFDKLIQINVKAPFFLSQKAKPHLDKQGGSMIFMSSVGGLHPEPLLGLYSMTKAALISLSKVIAKEWGPTIRSNVICPGLVKTRFAEAIWQNEVLVEEVVGKQPIARVAEPEEVAGLALFLASDAASYCTGGIYTVDGGHTL
jgi:dehydrogenase/reductase SDR family member 4